MRTNRKLSVVKLGAIAGLIVLSSVFGASVAAAATGQAALTVTVNGPDDGSPWDSPKPR